MISFSFLSLTAALLSLPALIYSVPTSCNNSPLLCNKAYNDVTHLCAHDSSFLRDASNGFSLAGNQFYNATVALSSGVRMLQAQVLNKANVLQLCHTLCTLLDAGPLEAWLLDIKIWMDNNPNEVVTLLLVNEDNDPVESFGPVFSSSGINKYGYTPSSTTGPIATWPTLETLITANTRLVTFVTSITYSPVYPYLIPEFNYVFETAFDVTSMQAFNCVLDRPATLASAASAISMGYLPLLNHFKEIALLPGVEVPDVDKINITNSADATLAGSLGLHVQTCQSEWGVKPTFILVDFFNVGQAMNVANSLNGISATTSDTSPTTSGISGTATGISTIGSGVSATATGSSETSTGVAAAATNVNVNIGSRTGEVRLPPGNAILAWAVVAGISFVLF